MKPGELAVQASRQQMKPDGRAGSTGKQAADEAGRKSWQYRQAGSR
jgi:hypothetical protein